MPSFDAFSAPYFLGCEKISAASVYTCVDPKVPFSAPSDETTASTTSVSGAADWADDDAAEPTHSSTTSTGSSGSTSSTGSSTGNASIDVGATSPPTGAEPMSPPPPPPGIGDRSGSPPPLRPTIASVGSGVAEAGEALMLTGAGFGEKVEDVRVMVGGRDCRDPELCHLVCRPCGDEDRCEFDEMCMEDGLSKEKVQWNPYGTVRWMIYL